MNQLHEEKLSMLVEDSIMIEAIHGVFSRRMEAEKPRTADGETDDIIGAKYRAYDKARDIINKTFQDILSYKVKAKNNNSYNKER